VAVVAVIVITTPVSGPVCRSAASTAATAAATVAVATTAGVAVAEYICYKTSHDCDIISQAKWENYHKTVFIERKMPFRFILYDMSGWWETGNYD
jgi:hypothetical protein